MAFQDRFKIGFHSHVALLLVLSLFFTKNSIVTSVPTQELDAMLSIVRARGYNLFCNAITTSDLEFDLLTATANASFTFFAPTDSALFALAMTQSAAAYTITLRYHGLPRRLSVFDLNRLPPEVPLRTLLRSQYVNFTRRLRGSRSPVISVNGVNVLRPGLYYGRHIAVHGLGGILSLHSQYENPYDAPPPVTRFRPNSPRSFPPEIDHGSEENGYSIVPAANHSIGGSSVYPPMSPNNFVDLPFSRIFLGPAPQRFHFQIEPPAISSVYSPSASPGFPPSDSSDSTLSMQNENAMTPISGAGDGDTAWMEDGLSGRTVEYEPLDWTTYGFSEGNSNVVDIEDSHPRPNVRRRF